MAFELGCYWAYLPECTFFRGQQFDTWIIGFIICGFVWILPNYIYWRKRRTLFNTFHIRPTPEPYAQPAEPEPQPEPEAPPRREERTYQSHADERDNGVDGVKSVEVDLEAKTAKVTFAAKVTNVPALELAVANAGYAANDKKADPEAYEKLAECCKVSDQ